MADRDLGSLRECEARQRPEAQSRFQPQRISHKAKPPEKTVSSVEAAGHLENQSQDGGQTPRKGGNPGKKPGFLLPGEREEERGQAGVGAVLRAGSNLEGQAEWALLPRGRVALRPRGRASREQTAA